jgi:hypothetical protein
MTLVVKDRVKETTTTTGTDTIDLAGAVTGFKTFVAAIGSSNTTFYAIEDANGSAWEVGIGTVTDNAGSPDTLARTTLLASSTGSKIELTSGTHTVFGTYPAGKAVHLDASGNLSHTVDISTDTNLVAGDGITLTGDTLSATSTTYSAGDGLDLSGTTFSTDLKANGGLVIESTEIAVDLAASSITGTLAITDGGTGATTLDNLIDSDHIVDGAIDTVHIGDLQVTTAKIADDAITGAKIADDAVTLGTHTTGAYVASLVAGSLINLTNNTGLETATPTIAVNLAGAATATPVDGDYVLFLDGGIGSCNDASYTTQATCEAAGTCSDGAYTTESTCEAAEETWTAKVWTAADGTPAKGSLADIATLFAGDGLIASQSVLAVKVDDSTIETNSDTLRVKDDGITLAKMAGIATGSIIHGVGGDPAYLAIGAADTALTTDGTNASWTKISNDMLTNDSVSYGGVEVDLGASDATPAFNLADATGLPIIAGTTGTLSVARGGTGVTSLDDITSASNLLAVTAGADTIIGGDVTLTINEGNFNLDNIGGVLGLTDQVTGILPVANGGTGASTLDNLITLGTHTTGNYVATLTGGTGITSTGANDGETIAHSISTDASQTHVTGLGTIGTGVWEATKIEVEFGGTNATSFANKAVVITQASGDDTLAAAAMTSSGGLLIGGSSGPAVATLTEGDNITITNADGAITIASEPAATETIQDIVGAMLTAGTTTLVDITYQDAANAVDVVVNNDLNDYDNTISQFVKRSDTEVMQDMAGPLIATGGTKTGLTVSYDDENGTVDMVVADTTFSGDSGSVALTPGTEAFTIAGGTNTVTVLTTSSPSTLTISTKDTTYTVGTCTATCATCHESKAQCEDGGGTWTNAGISAGASSCTATCATCAESKEQCEDGGGTWTFDSMSVDVKANSGVVLSGGQVALDMGASAVTGALGLTNGGTGVAFHIAAPVQTVGTCTATCATCPDSKAQCEDGGGTWTGAGLTAGASSCTASCATCHQSKEQCEDGGGTWSRGSFAVDVKANSGVVLSSGQVALNLGASSITGTLGASSGGTGATSLTNFIDTGKIADDAVTTGKIADNQVTTGKIADNQVTTGKMAGIARGGCIVGDENGDPSVLAPGSEGQILIIDGDGDAGWGDNTGGSDHHDHYTASTGMVLGGSAFSTHASQTHVTGLGTITTGVWNATKITGAYIADDAIDSQHYVDGSIDTAHIGDLQVTTAKIAADAIDGTKLADNAVDSEHYTDASIDTAHIAADQITSALIADDQIDSEHYVDGSIDTAHIGDLQVTTGKIAADAIDGTKLADNAVDSEHYTDGSIDTAHIAADQIVGSLIADDAVDSEHIAAGAIDTAHIGDLQVTTAKVAADAITGAKIADNAIDSEHYTDLSIDTAHIGNLQVTTGKIAADAIDGTKLADNAVDSEHYTDGSIDTAHIGADQITSALIADDQIDSEHIVDGAVDLAHMSAESVDSDQYVDASIDLAHMSAESVDSDQYVDGSIDLIHLSADSVDGTKIVDDAIDSEHYTDGSIDLAHMSDESVDSDQYVDLSIDTAHIGNLQVTTAKIAADAIDGTKLADDAVDSEHYTDESIDTAHIADDQVTLAKMAGITRGSIIIGNASGDPAALALGSDNYVLTSDGTDIAWEAAAGGGGTPTAITVADESSDTTCFPLFVTAATGDLGPKSGSNLTFNSNTGILTTTGLVIADGGNIGSASDTDAITIAAEGDVTFSKATKPAAPAAASGTSGIVVLDCNTTNHFTITTSGNITGWNFTNASPGQRIIVRVTNGASHTVAFSATGDGDVIHFPGGTEPTLTTSSGIDLYGFLCIAADTLDGFIIGQDIKA